MDCWVQPVWGVTCDASSDKVGGYWRLGKSGSALHQERSHIVRAATRWKLQSTLTMQRTQGKEGQLGRNKLTWEISRKRTWWKHIIERVCCLRKRWCIEDWLKTHLVQFAISETWRIPSDFYLCEIKMTNNKDYLCSKYECICTTNISVDTATKKNTHCWFRVVGALSPVRSCPCGRYEISGELCQTLHRCNKRWHSG